MLINNFLEGESLYYFIETSKVGEIKVVFAFEQASH